MKKGISILAGLLLCALLLAGCGKKEAESADLVTVQFSCEGEGRIILGEEGETVRESSLTLPEGQIITADVLAEEGWFFITWEKNGEEFSAAPGIRAEAEEGAVYTAVFGEGSGEASIDLSSLKTVEDLVRYTEEWDYTLFDGSFVYVFALDEIFYRAIAEVPAETEEAIAGLDLSDPLYNDKVNDLLMGLEVDRIENISAAIPSKEALDALTGKTGADLLDDGWYVAYGYDLETMQFYMNKGLFSYVVTFDGALENVDASGKFEELRPLRVLSVAYEGLGDAADLDVELEAVH